jgi:signal transduction histidine kinase
MEAQKPSHRKFMNSKSKSNFDRIISWFIKNSWQTIVIIGLSVLFFEITELVIKNESLYDPYHIIELVGYFILLLSMGVLIKHLVKANADQNHTLEILKYKHDISLELTKLENWDVLIAELVRLPDRIVETESSQLYILNPMSNELEFAANWNKNGTESAEFQRDCQHCKNIRLKGELSPRICTTEVFTASKRPLREFCIPIVFGNKLLGVIQTKLLDDAQLSLQDIEIFENIIPEVALVLKVGQEQKAISELLLAKTALAERRTLSSFIHDQLAQNLGFLHLKLDQLIADENIQKNKNLRSELGRLCDTADESYEIVRDILKAIQPETVPHITNLLREYARNISQRSSFELNFETMGDRVPLPTAVQQTIFYIFREIISNVEKHANASKVDVLVVWNDGFLDISVADNGKGFEPGKVQVHDHFGLAILQERLAGIKGKLAINSSLDSGTVVSISVPVQSFEKAAA